MTERDPEVQERIRAIKARIAEGEIKPGVTAAELADWVYIGRRSCLCGKNSRSRLGAWWHKLWSGPLT